MVIHSGECADRPFTGSYLAEVAPTERNGRFARSPAAVRPLMHVSTQLRPRIVSSAAITFPPRNSCQLARAFYSGRWKSRVEPTTLPWTSHATAVDNRLRDVDEDRSCVETRNHHMLRSASRSDHNILCLGLDVQTLEAYRCSGRKIARAALPDTPASPARMAVSRPQDTRRPRRRSNAAATAGTTRER
jgi:hypothetical protein